MPVASPKPKPTPKVPASKAPPPAAAGTYATDFGPEFQFHLLAVCARVPDFVPRFRTALDHTYFARDLDRLIAKALFAHLDAHRVPPHRTTLTEACRSLANPDELPAVQQALDAIWAEEITDHPAVAALAVNFGKTQAMANAVLEAAEELDHGNRQKIIPIIQKAALVGEDLLSVGLRYADWPQRKEWYLAPPELAQLQVIPTGIPHLDHALRGGLRRGELGVVLAPPKRGKTSTLINFGFGALTQARPPRGGEEAPETPRGFNVLHLSLEMHQEDILRRYDDRLAGVEGIREKHTDIHKYVALLEREQPRVLGDLYVKSFPTRSLSATSIRALLTLLVARGFTPDLLLVDYADIMKPERRLGEMRHEQAGIYEDLRTIAGEFQCVVWTGSQASKGALEKETITIADFAEAFEKAAIVDCAVGFCQTDNERIENPQQCRLFLAAYRNQEDGRTVYCNIHRAACVLQSVRLQEVTGEHIALPCDPTEERRRVPLQPVTREAPVPKAPARAKATPTPKAHPPAPAAPVSPGAGAAEPEEPVRPAKSPAAPAAAATRLRIHHGLQPKKRWTKPAGAKPTAHKKPKVSHRPTRKVGGA